CVENHIALRVIRKGNAHVVDELEHGGSILGGQEVHLRKAHGLRHGAAGVSELRTLQDIQVFHDIEVFARDHTAHVKVARENAVPQGVKRYYLYIRIVREAGLEFGLDALVEGAITNARGIAGQERPDVRFDGSGFATACDRFNLQVRCAVEYGVFDGELVRGKLDHD